MMSTRPTPKRINIGEDFLVGLDGNNCVGIGLVKKVDSGKISAQIGIRVTEVDYDGAIILKPDGTYLIGDHYNLENK